MCNIVKFLYLLCKTVGVAPISLDCSKGKLVISFVGRLYSAVVALLLLGVIYTIPSSASDTSDVKDHIARYSYTWCSVLSLLAGIAPLIRSCTMKQHHVDSVFAKVLAVDALLYKVRLTRYIQSPSLLWVSLTGTFILICLSYVHASMISPDVINIRVLMPSFILDIIRTCNIQQFFTLNLMLRERFKKLNDKLLQIFGIFTETELDIVVAASLRNFPDSFTPSRIRKSVTGENFLHGKASIFSPITSTSKFSHNSFIHHAPVTTMKSRNRLTQLQGAHLLLCEVSRTINIVHSVQNLFQIVSSFFCSVVFGYSLVMNVLDLKLLISVEAKVSVIVTSLLSVSASVWWLGNLICSSEMVKRESSCTARLVKKLLLVPPPTDGSCREELQLFAQQLAGGPVDYSAAGLFSLDLSMVKTAAAAIATYLVILVQFGLSDKSNQLNSVDVKGTT
ncbi:putative gustatory receptor 28a [Schistocerca gregaria]|uniref:putative gustatory receptor 28a n=1 Tax=Schistocerca gregaria TaxID=7010 RepID=UPI00211DBF91|nr:putative gustatory receptor 28a [Schistocerca gregaria]